MTQIIPTAEPFFFPGRGEAARIGCLLTHGFTGTPREMRPLGEYLQALGYTVYGIRLAGHATRPADMIRCRWQDWLLSVEDGYHLLHGTAEQVFLLGLSMGGALSLTFASAFPVRGVVAMSTPYELPADPRLRWVKPLSHLLPCQPKGKLQPGRDWFDPQAFAQHVDYPCNPLRSVGELNDLLGAMRGCLAAVSVPVLLISSRDDHSIPEKSMDYIYGALGSEDRQELWIEGSGHVITEEPRREDVFRAAGAFIQRVSCS
jgi:carboxylesterase